jgi:hypothetical protein
VTHYFALLALDLANERVREAEDRQRVRLAREAQAERPEAYDWLPDPSLFSALRRGLARATAAISIGAAAATRRLDDNVAEDLGRSLAVAD